VFKSARIRASESSTYFFVVAYKSAVGAGTIGDDENVFIPAIVSFPDIPTVLSSTYFFVADCISVVGVGMIGELLKVLIPLIVSSFVL